MRTQTTALLVGATLLAGCFSGPKEYQPYSSTSRSMYLESVRAYAAEPVYSRTRWVQLPEVLPERELPTDDARLALGAGPALRPVYQLSVKNASLEETARILAAMARYESYTSPEIAKKKFSIENLGTIDELGEIVGHKAEIQVVIDHENKEVRFLAPNTEEPRLFSE